MSRYAYACPNCGRKIQLSNGAPSRMHECRKKGLYDDMKATDPMIKAPSLSAN